MVFCHGVGVCHRNLSIDQLSFSSIGRMKILNFGLGVTCIGANVLFWMLMFSLIVSLCSFFLFLICREIQLFCTWDIKSEGDCWRYEGWRLVHGGYFVYIHHRFSLSSFSPPKVRCLLLIKTNLRSPATFAYIGVFPQKDGLNIPEELLKAAVHSFSFTQSNDCALLLSAMLQLDPSVRHTMLDVNNHPWLMTDSDNDDDNDDDVRIEDGTVTVQLSSSPVQSEQMKTPSNRSGNFSCISCWEEYWTKCCSIARVFTHGKFWPTWWYTEDVIQYLWAGFCCDQYYEQKDIFFVQNRQKSKLSKIKNCQKNIWFLKLVPHFDLKYFKF